MCSVLGQINIEDLAIWCRERPAENNGASAHGPIANKYDVVYDCATRLLLISDEYRYHTLGEMLRANDRGVFTSRIREDRSFPRVSKMCDTILVGYRRVLEEYLEYTARAEIYIEA
jgi:hypothetical protein